MTVRKYRVIKALALGSPDYLGRGTVYRHLPGDIIDLDDGAAKGLGRYLEPYYEPPKQRRPATRKPEPEPPHPESEPVTPVGEVVSDDQ